MVAYMRSNDLDMAACGSLFVDADTMKVRGIRNIQSLSLIHILNLIVDNDNVSIKPENNKAYCEMDYIYAYPGIVLSLIHI